MTMAPDTGQLFPTDPPDDHTDPPGGVFAFDVDERTFRHDQPRITGGEIMDLAGIPRAQGLVRLHADGTTTAVAADADVYLVRGLHFRRRPRFKRG
jgi:hypothetical protein